MTVLRLLSGQFYLNWHALYNDLQILTIKSDIDQIIFRFKDMGDEILQQAMFLDTKVHVVYGEIHVSVAYCTFSAWNGFKQVREVYQRQFPHVLVGEKDILVKIPYDCGVRF